MLQDDERELLQEAARMPSILTSIGDDDSDIEYLADKGYLIAKGSGEYTISNKGIGFLIETGWSPIIDVLDRLNKLIATYGSNDEWSDEHMGEFLTQNNQDIHTIAAHILKRLERQHYIKSQYYLGSALPMVTITRSGREYFATAPDLKDLFVPQTITLPVKIDTSAFDQSFEELKQKMDEILVALQTGFSITNTGKLENKLFQELLDKNPFSDNPEYYELMLFSLAERSMIRASLGIQDNPLLSFIAKNIERLTKISSIASLIVLMQTKGFI